MNHGKDNLDDGDELASMFGGTASATPVERKTPPADFVPILERVYNEPCSKCRGTGRWGYTQRTCFTCNGTGKLTFKTSPEQRAKAQARSVAKATEKRVARMEWQEQHKAELAWLNTAADRQLSLAHNPNHKTWAFPIDLQNSLTQYGTLTDGQIGAIRKCMARDAERKAAAVEQRKADAPVVDTAGIDRLKEAFDRAVAYSAEKGLRLSPRLTIDGVTIKPAKATSTNPGALYVSQGKEYLGKIKDGRFYAVAACPADLQAKVLAFIADPAEAAKVYGQTTGTCCVCNATLISKWKHRGIGPICAEKFGW